MAARIKKDDMVVVISGDHRGAQGKVLRILPDKDRVIVEGVNMVMRHVRKSRKYPQGGRVQKEAALPLCKVMPIDPKTGKGTRVRFKVERNAAGHVISKQRLSEGGTVLGEVTRAKPQGKGA
jgi:large subunit ribosomal protein L24